MKAAKDARTRLLEAATRLFAQRGFDGTSVRDLTRRARTNLGAVTYHFGSKAALYYAAIAALAEPLVERIARAAAAPSRPVDRIEAIVRAFLDYVGAHPELPTLILRELASERRLPPPAEEAMRRNFSVLVDAITAGQRDGTVRPGDPVLLALSVMAQPFHFAIASRVVLAAAGINPADAAVRARMVEHIAQAVRWVVATNPRTP
jgi:AcrR family transcriptional regulator